MATRRDRFVSKSQGNLRSRVYIRHSGGATTKRLVGVVLGVATVGGIAQALDLCGGDLISLFVASA